jgi:hypothetical protein
MEGAERQSQVRRFVDEVWNGRNYEARSLISTSTSRSWIGADNLGLFVQLGVLVDPWPK